MILLKKLYKNKTLNKLLLLLLVKTPDLIDLINQMFNISKLICLKLLLLNKLKSKN